MDHGALLAQSTEWDGRQSALWLCADVNNIIQILNQAARFQPSGSPALGGTGENPEPPGEQEWSYSDWTGPQSTAWTGDKCPTEQVQTIPNQAYSNVIIIELQTRKLRIQDQAGHPGSKCFPCVCHGSFMCRQGVFQRPSPLCVSWGWCHLAGHGGQCDTVCTEPRATNGPQSLGSAERGSPARTACHKYRFTCRRARIHNVFEIFFL